VSADTGDEGPTLTALESVRCLECGSVYAKPVDGGTVRQNPGCPECGYVGWVAIRAPRFTGWPPSRFVEDQLRQRRG
jgi:hypothetical protein